MKKLIGITLLSFCIWGLTFAEDFVWQDISRGNVNLYSVLVCNGSRIIYVGSNRGVLKSEDTGDSWRTVLSINGQNRTVNFLLLDCKDKNSVYAATGNGLFRSFNQGKDWKKIFQGKNYLENECTTLAVLPYAIYLGTKGGLFFSKDNGRSWYKESGRLGTSHILAIAYNIKEPNYIYLACVYGVFRTKDAGQSWERIFITDTTKEDNDKEEFEDIDEEKHSYRIRYISIDPCNPNNIYLATSIGIYKSQDRGMSWELISGYGLLNQEVRFLLISSQSKLYAVTKSGIFVYDNERWYELSLRLVAQDIRFLTQDEQNNLYAACDRGLFRTSLKKSCNYKQADIVSFYCKDEPTISEIQKIAIKYAEVEPEKIARWRKQAAKRALLPKLTIDMDRYINRTTSSNIWGTYGSNGSPGRYFVGPDDVTKYNNKNWGISLTWELGDLIWSDDQTSIDIRSRLMVQLRNDILDEVTKLYFERLRVKMELDNLSLEERKKRLEKELRIRELTASIDALTGGYFSQQIKNTNIKF